MPVNMKNTYQNNINICNLLSLIMITLITNSCEIFQKEPLDSVPEEQVWNDPSVAKLYVNNLYKSVYDLTMDGFQATANSDKSDEAFGGNIYMYGMVSSGDVGDFSNDTYACIRKINIFINRIGTGTLPQTEIQYLKGQAHFLRAWMYWNLVKLYGGVPMILGIQNVSYTGYPTEELMVKRNKTKECIEIICADLDTAIQYLPAKWKDNEDYGRATSAAAISLKGRILLFWASPQFNPQNKSERWEWAYNVNKAAIDTLKNNGYGLYPSFKELFEDCKEQTCEAIFVRVFSNKLGDEFTHDYDKSVRPKNESASGGGTKNFPTWQLVKAFPMINGNPIDSSANSFKYDSILYFLNRDKRFYYTIAYNTCNWNVCASTGNKLWTYYHWYPENNPSKPAELISVEGTSFTPTGFYCRKYVNPYLHKDLTDKVGTDWMEIRYAEVMLNYAECANELGKSSEVYAMLKSLRNDRTDLVVAGVDNMGYINKHINDQTLTREIIMTERQVELAFENKRYWDLRRRNMFVDDLGPTVKKLNGTYRTGKMVQQYPSTEVFPGAIYKPESTDEGFKLIRNTTDFTIKRYFNTYFDISKSIVYSVDYINAINYRQPQYNFFAIPQSNIDKNKNLEQTSYWGGTFDPLAE
jgi:hypothetical protein